MTKEVKLIKKYLKNKYPDLKFKAYKKIPSSYVNSSDKIIIEIEYKAGLTTEKIIEDIRHIVKGIEVGRFKEQMSMWNTINPFIFDIESNKWIEVEAEFIEIK